MLNTKAKETMNSEITTPAYIVTIVDLANPNRYTPRIFRDASLLDSRQAAFSHVGRVLNQKLAHEVLQVKIELAEIDRSSVGGKHKVLSIVFSQRFQRIAFMKDGKDLLATMQMDDFTKRSLPPSLFKTIDLEDEAPDSLESLWSRLDELENEAGYYQNNGYQTGFGFVQIEQLVEYNLIKKGLAQPAPSTYVVLYDAFAYAASIVSRFNDNCTDENNILSFDTQFLSPRYHLEEVH